MNASTPKNQKIHKQNDYNVDESTTSSFYSSFLYKSSESSCNLDQKPTEYLPEASDTDIVQLIAVKFKHSML